MRLEKEAPIVKTFIEPCERNKASVFGGDFTNGAGPAFIAGANASPREVAVFYNPGYNTDRKIVTGFMVYCGNQDGPPTNSLFRGAIMGRNGFWDVGAGGTAGLPTTVIGGLKMDAGVTWLSGRGTGMGDANSRLARYTFDQPSVLEAGTPFFLTIMAELMYVGGGGSDTGHQARWGGIDHVCWPNAEQHVVSSLARPLIHTSLGAAAGIDAEAWSTWENPATTALIGTVNQGTTTTIGGKTVNVATMPYLMYWLICQEA